MSDLWDGLVGQTGIVGQFQMAARAAVKPTATEQHSAMTQSWLVTGPPGSGRSTLARYFAAALECADTDNPGCGVCRGCQLVLGGSHPDVVDFSTELVQITIDEIRTLVQKSYQAPSSGRWRVIIIQDADRMNQTSSNVLLKALEEPPDNTVWVLCAPSPEDVLTTIRSRCRTVTMRTPSAEAIAKLLSSDPEHPVDYDTALTAARVSQSHIGMARYLARNPEAMRRRRDTVLIPARIRSMTDAINAAHQLLDLATAQANADTEARENAEKRRLAHLLGIDPDSPDTSVKERREFNTRLRELTENQKRRARRDLRDAIDRVLIDWQGLYRDVYIVQTGAKTPIINADVPETVQQIATESTPEITVARIDAIRTARERIARNTPAALALEALALELRPLPR
ncbi:MAG: DNA polymerase III subunit delta' [Varibaculum sp.]|nr:DNA polymerase III subunit delta' [Varibaculum sp.]